MSALTSGMDAALAADRAIVTLFIKVELPGHTIRLLIGKGAVAWGLETYSGIDTTFGTIAAIDTIEDGLGDQAPAFGFTLHPPSNSSAAEISSAAYQGSAVTAWLAAIHPTSGLLIPDPYQIFAGTLDQPKLNLGSASRSVDFECVSDFERLLEDDEGARLSDAFHQSIWPGETGMANITGVEQTVYWGVTNPNPVYNGPVIPGLPGGILGGLGNMYL